MLTRMITQAELAVRTLGEPRYRSPLPMSTMPDDGVGDFVSDDSRVLYDIRLKAGQVPSDLSFESAGPRERLFFDPPRTRAAIVTCGGLCPGINNVIRTLFFELTANYGIREVLGIRFGYQGLNPEGGKPPIVLTADIVEGIHHLGGTILGTSRGPQEPAVMVGLLSSGQTSTSCSASAATARSAARTTLPAKLSGANCRSPSSACPRRSTTTSSSARRRSASPRPSRKPIP